MRLKRFLPVLSVLFALFLLPAAVCLAAGEGENLIENGDFSGEDTSEFAVSGRRDHFDFSIRTERIDEQRKNSYARLEIAKLLDLADGTRVNTGLGIGGARGWDLEQPGSSFDVKPGTTYAFALDMRGTVGAASINALIWPEGGEGYTRGRQRIRTTVGRADVKEEWTRYEGTFTTGEDAWKGSLFVSLWCDGSRGLKTGDYFDVDNVEIREQGPAAAEASEAGAPRIFESPDKSLENIALGKPYTLSHNPNYSLTRDEEKDKTALTDGELSRDSGFWTQKSTVGWQSIRNEGIEITVDLGRVEPIRGFGLRSAAGASEVFWAHSLPVFVSEDGEDFFLACDLVEAGKAPLPPAYGTYGTHWFWTDELETKGRYVTFVVLPSHAYFFTDEVEVYGGDDSFLEQAYAGSPVTVEDMLDRDRLTKLGAYRRIRRDREKLARLVEASGLDQSEKDLFNERLENMSVSPGGIELSGGWRDFKAVAPLNRVHEQILALHGEYLAAVGAPGLNLWESPPCSFLELFSEPGTGEFGLEVKMLQNERRPAAFNITNASGRQETVRFTLSGMPGGANPDYIHVYEAEFADTAQGLVMQSPLVRLRPSRGGYTSVVPAGMTRQIWIQVDSKDLSPGEHAGSVRVRGRGLNADIPLGVEVAPYSMPGRREMSCSLSLWDYIHNLGTGITEENKQLAKDDIYDHVVDSVWAHGWTSMPRISRDYFDDDGNLTGEIDFSMWDAFVEEWPGMKHYFVFAGYRAGSRFAGWREGTEEFDNAISQWSAAWAEHNDKNLGLEPGQAGILWIDEPSRKEQFRTSYYLARGVNLGTDGITVFNDPMWRALAVDYGREMFKASNIMSPQPGHVMSWPEEDQKFFRSLPEEHGVRLAFYQCATNRHRNTSYFRMQPWYLYDFGGDSSHFWSYGCQRTGSSWNEYWPVGSGNYAIPYISPTSITNSKHWEALRAGIQDYEYIVILRDRVRELREKGVDDSLLREAEAFAGTVAGDVTASTFEKYGRGHSANHPFADVNEFAEEARIEIFDMLKKLAAY